MSILLSVSLFSSAVAPFSSKFFSTLFLKSVALVPDALLTASLPFSLKLVSLTTFLVASPSFPSATFFLTSSNLSSFTTLPKLF